TTCRELAAATCGLTSERHHAPRRTPQLGVFRTPSSSHWLASGSLKPRTLCRRLLKHCV
ncbi:hypothetical protein C8Q79DRAFT_989323, partial [Trametes meyenii]